MSNLLSNTTDLQEILHSLKYKATVQSTPEISLNEMTGLITATAGNKDSNKQLKTHPGATITPTTTPQTVITAGTYVTGDIIVKSVTTDTNAHMEFVNNFINRSFSTYTDDQVTFIGDYAFAGCKKLSEVSFPAVKTIGFRAFTSCYDLLSAYFPAATTIRGSAFGHCSKITELSFPDATTISSAAFDYCYSLATVSFPVASTIGNTAFAYCYSLASVCFPAATTIGSSAFNRCRTLSAIYLPGSSICALSHSNAFTSTPYAGYSKYFSGTPHIYVPASLLTSYQTATNWTYFSKYFSAID